MTKRPSPALAAEAARLLAPAVQAYREAQHRPVVEAGADATHGETPTAATPPAGGRRGRGQSVGTAPGTRAAPQPARPADPGALPAT